MGAKSTNPVLSSPSRFEARLALHQSRIGDDDGAGAVRDHLAERVAREADQMGLEALVSVARWKGYVEDDTIPRPCTRSWSPSSARPSTTSAAGASSRTSAAAGTARSSTCSGSRCASMTIATPRPGRTRTSRAPSTRRSATFSESRSRASDRRFARDLRRRSAVDLGCRHRRGDHQLHRLPARARALAHGSAPLLARAGLRRPHRPAITTDLSNTNSIEVTNV